MSLGKRLKAARTSKGYSQRQVQRLSGVAFSVISKAERGVGDLNSQTLEKLAKCYGMTIDSLILDNAPSFRADPAAIRRAVLLADLTAMANNLETGDDAEEDIALLLNNVAYAIHRGYVADLLACMEPLTDAWLDGALREMPQEPSQAPEPLDASVSSEATA